MFAHPVFLHAAQNAPKAWIPFFTRLAKGDLPPGVVVQDEKLRCDFGKVTWIIDLDNPKVLCKKILERFSDHELVETTETEDKYTRNDIEHYLDKLMHDGVSSKEANRIRAKIELAIFCRLAKDLSQDDISNILNANNFVPRIEY